VRLRARSQQRGSEFRAYVGEVGIDSGEEINEFVMAEEGVY